MQYVLGMKKLSLKDDALKKKTMSYHKLIFKILQYYRPKVFFSKDIHEIQLDYM